jgi:hypothetical protein
MDWNIWTTNESGWNHPVREVILGTTLENWPISYGRGDAIDNKKNIELRLHRSVLDFSSSVSVHVRHLNKNRSIIDEIPGFYQVNLKQNPTAPKKLRAKAISWRKVKLTWKSDSKNINGFLIYRKKDKDGNWVNIGKTRKKTRSFTDNGLEGNSIFYYQVRAFNNCGYSPYSNTAKTKTKKR